MTTVHWVAWLMHSCWSHTRDLQWWLHGELNSQGGTATVSCPLSLEYCRVSFWRWGRKANWCLHRERTWSLSCCSLWHCSRTWSIESASSVQGCKGQKLSWFCGQWLEFLSLEFARQHACLDFCLLCIVWSLQQFYSVQLFRRVSSSGWSAVQEGHLFRRVSCSGEQAVQ